MRFLDCQIFITKKVFQPRIETEFWVEKALRELKKIKKRKLEILDIFAGTGCIGIAVLKNLPEFYQKVDFADVSKKAIEEIKINLKLNKIPKRKYRIYQSNIFEKLKAKRYDVIFANPPYVAKKRIAEVQKEILEREPKMALFAGLDGMDLIRRFFKEVKNHLKNQGVFYLEFDPQQKKEIKKILEKEGFKFSFHKDQFKKFRWFRAQILKNQS